jgi:putative sigma-54 modulation protein
MNINIKGTHIELTEAITNYVHTKFDGLNKLFSNPSEVFVQVEVGKDSNHHAKGDVFKAEANVEADGHQHYVVVIKDDLYAAIDELKDELMEKVKSTKDKSRSRFRRGAGKVKNFIKGLWPWKGDQDISE